MDPTRLERGFSFFCTWSVAERVGALHSWRKPFPMLICLRMLDCAALRNWATARAHRRQRLGSRNSICCTHRSVIRRRVFFTMGKYFPNTNSKLFVPGNGGARVRGARYTLKLLIDYIV